MQVQEILETVAVQLEQLTGKHWNQYHIVGNYLIDFALTDLKIGVDIDHDEYTDAQAYEGRCQRDRWLVRQGWTVLRFTGTELVAENFAPLQEIADYLRSIGVEP